MPFTETGKTRGKQIVKENRVLLEFMLNSRCGSDICVGSVEQTGVVRTRDRVYFSPQMV